MAKTPKSDDFGYEDPLENLLDEESDEEFGLPEFKEHLADELTPAVLKDWTAQDFASIYVRFRPHLERHARRFLNNQTQVEEVVQDAFLYLMTTLPELDSELGVLKFLKWKTRLLALDVIRANSKRYMAPLDEQPDLVADLPEMGIELERAEDAAIVSLALAKLQPRHREALIASVYEEKSTEVVAAQLGLSENATRQLLFRARAAFKKALVGEAETAGLSISQILSLAAKKAAQESGKILGAAGAFLLVLAISLGVIPGLVPSAPEEQQVAESAPVETTNPENTVPGGSNSGENIQEEPIAAADSTPQIVPAATWTNVAATPEPSPTGFEEERVVLAGFMAEVLDKEAIALLSRTTTGVVSVDSLETAGALTVKNDSGLLANVSYDLATERGIQHVWLSIDVAGTKFVAVPKASLAEKVTDSFGNVTLRYLATDLLIGDESGSFNYIALENTAVSLGALRLEIKLDQNGKVESSSLFLASKS